MKKGKWTYQEEELLKKLYLEKEDKELVEILNRTIPSIVQRRKKLGLTKNSSEKFKISCLNCNKKFTVPYSRKEAQFCSRKCKGEHTKKIVVQLEIVLFVIKSFMHQVTRKQTSFVPENVFMNIVKREKPIIAITAGKIFM